MGHMKYQVLVDGSLGHPQPSLMQNDSFHAIRQVDRYLYFVAADLHKPLVDPRLVLELEQAKIKFKRKDLIMVVKDSQNMIVWLEQGTHYGGYKHMKERGHLREIQDAFGIPEEEVPRFIRAVMRGCSLVSEEIQRVGKHNQITRVYQYKNLGKLLVALGDNGFIVSAFPYNHSKKK